MNTNNKILLLILYLKEFFSLRSKKTFLSDREPVGESPLRSDRQGSLFLENFRQSYQQSWLKKYEIYRSPQNRNAPSPLSCGITGVRSWGFLLLI